MSQWRLVPTAGFARQMRGLDRQVARRIDRTLKAIVATGDPRTSGKALSGEWGGFWRYRVGGYRVICELRDSELVVLALRAAPRDKAYKQAPLK